MNLREIKKLQKILIPVMGMEGWSTDADTNQAEIPDDRCASVSIDAYQRRLVTHWDLRHKDLKDRARAEETVVHEMVHAMLMRASLVFDDVCKQYVVDEIKIGHITERYQDAEEDAAGVLSRAFYAVYCWLRNTKFLDGGWKE